MASDSMFSQNNPPLKNGESILVNVRKIFSLLTAAIVNHRRDCDFSCLVQDVVCFKPDNSIASHEVLRENRRRFFIKTLERHWHAGCLNL
ncbi:hypothetical protein GA0061098_103624 [Bradyrhizobium shewense]|uniref:Uncharacterized protein n=2 Tax=Bradyrhizobium shewense TaxID=1761772 RepID=A0A1C3XSF0_9BRAD|nr:hypothetical protein GA0061098_103624 [Bradyrhizobium shewense]